MASQRFRAGAFVRISLDEKHHTYGRLVGSCFVAVYDARATKDIDDLESVSRRPVLFIVAVMRRATRSGRWPIVGFVPLRPGELAVPDAFMQDLFNHRQLRIVDVHGRERPATLAEVEGLERVAVWAAEHIEDRIRDHYAGRPNVWVEQLKVKRY